MPPPAHGLASRLIAGPTLRTQSDRRLVGLVREGYEAAFEEIVRRYGRQLGRYAAAIVGNRSEDVTQDAFSKALLALRRDDGEVELRPWLYRIVRNTALNDLRDRPAAAVELAESIAIGSNPAETLEQREELAELMGRLRALPEAQRAAIVMRELEGLGHEEIAAALGMSGGGARQAIYRARRALRDGAGMLFPLPLLKALLEGPTAAEAAGGAAGVAGTGIAVKATAATVLVAGTVGASVALQERRDGREPGARASVVAEKPGSNGPATSAPLAAPVLDDDSGSGSSSGHGSSSSGPGGGGEDRSGPSGGEDSGRSGGDRSGRDVDSDDDTDFEDVDEAEDRSGPSESSGSSGGSESSGSGSSGSESSGSGSGESYGSGVSGSGSSGSDSSGSSSGSGSEPEYELDGASSGNDA